MRNVIVVGIVDRTRSDLEAGARAGVVVCEWRAALEDPDKLERFRAFVNDGPNPSIVFTRQREQNRPAAWEEKAELVEKAG